MLFVPAHLLADAEEVGFGDGARLVHIEQLEDLSVDVVAGELADVTFFTVGPGARSLILIHL